MKKTEVTTVLYNEDGVVCNKEDNAVAKKISTEEANSFYVKRGTSGLEATRLLNVNSMWYDKDKVFNKKIGKNVFEYSKVTETCFNLYLRFLQTKNVAYLRNAEREIQ
jgi:hypothetical protein